MKAPFERAAACSTEEDPIVERRANPRFNSASVVLITNLSRATKAFQGLMLDLSTTGMRVETTLPFHIGDAVRVDLPNVTVLAEVVHYAVISKRAEVGLAITSKHRQSKYMRNVLARLAKS
jgi:hypothetical protein